MKKLNAKAQMPRIVLSINLVIDFSIVFLATGAAQAYRGNYPKAPHDEETVGRGENVAAETI